jgi:hypothetical protein
MRAVTLCLLAACAVAQTPKKPFQAQSTSSISYTLDKDNGDRLEITNVVYDWPRDLVLRETTHTKYVIGDIGRQASTTVEAWPLGVDLKQKPQYSFTVEGDDPRAINAEVIQVSRGLEEIDWWSIYSLANGAHLFDTYVPLAHFSISRDTLQLRYAGIEVPPDYTKDPRLNAPNVVAVLTYAAADRVIREALITCDDPKQAQLLRSFADSTRTLSYSGGALRLSISQNYPSPPATVTITVPVTRDDLDLARVQARPGIRVAAWKR